MPTHLLAKHDTIAELLGSEKEFFSRTGNLAARQLYRDAQAFAGVELYRHDSGFALAFRAVQGGEYSLLTETTGTLQADSTAELALALLHRNYVTQPLHTFVIRQVLPRVPFLDVPAVLEPYEGVRVLGASATHLLDGPLAQLYMTLDNTTANWEHHGVQEIPGQLALALSLFTAQHWYRGELQYLCAMLPVNCSHPDPSGAIELKLFGYALSSAISVNSPILAVHAPTRDEAVAAARAACTRKTAQRLGAMRLVYAQLIRQLALTRVQAKLHWEFVRQECEKLYPAREGMHVLLSWPMQEPVLLRTASIYTRDGRERAIRETNTSILVKYLSSYPGAPLGQPAVPAPS